MSHLHLETLFCLGASNKKETHTYVHTHTKANGVFEFSNLPVCCAAARSNQTTCATTLPKIINGGSFQSAPGETPSLRWRNIYPSNRLFLVPTLFMWLNVYFCLALQFELSDIVYPDRAPCTNYMRGIIRR